jgi:hypothetical protein
MMWFCSSSGEAVERLYLRIKAIPMAASPDFLQSTLLGVIRWRRQYEDVVTVLQ